MRYLHRTKDFMLFYNNRDELEIIEYADSDFGLADYMKSTFGYVSKLAGRFHGRVLSRP